MRESTSQRGIGEKGGGLRKHFRPVGGKFQNLWPHAGDRVGRRGPLIAELLRPALEC